LKGNGVMSIGQIIRSRLQEELRHHRVMASVITHQLATMPADIEQEEKE